MQCKCRNRCIFKNIDQRQLPVLVAATIKKVWYMNNKHENKQHGAKGNLPVLLFVGDKGDGR